MSQLVRRAPTRREIAAVIVVVLVALGIRVYAVYAANALHGDVRTRLSADEPGYDNLARDVLAGHGFTWPGRVPLYPTWVAANYAVNGGSYNKTFYAQTVLGALAVLLTYLLGRALFGHATGLLAATAAAAHHALVQQSTRLLSEVLFTPAVLLIVLVVKRAIDHPSVARFAIAGVTIGISNLIRPTFVLFPLFLAIIVFFVRSRRVALRASITMLLSSSLVVLPWMIRNYVRYDAVLPLATSNAILWQGSPEYYHLVKDQRYTYLQVWNEVIYGPGNEGHDPGTVAGERYWTARALRSILAEPHIYALFFTEKLATYWVGDPNADWNDTFVFNFRALRQLGASRWQTAQIMAVRLLPLAALLAVVVLWRSRRMLLPLYAVIAYCALFHAATHAEVRLSEPLHPLLLIVIAQAALVAQHTITAQRGNFIRTRRAAEAGPLHQSLSQ